MFDGGIFCWQAKSIEANWKPHILPTHARKARTCIRRRHRIPMARMQIAAGVGEHGQEIPLLFLWIFYPFVETRFFPGLLPLLFDGLGIVTVGHDDAPENNNC